MKRSTFEQYIKEYCEDLALKENSHQYKRCRHACVLTYNDTIISSGVNSRLFNDFTKQYNDLKALHAEPVAIMRAMKHHSKIIHKCELWVCRNNAVSKESRPCPMCQKIIKSFGIKRIHYTRAVGDWVEEMLWTPPFCLNTLLFLAHFLWMKYVGGNVKAKLFMKNIDLI